MSGPHCLQVQLTLVTSFPLAARSSSDVECLNYAYVFVC